MDSQSLNLKNPRHSDSMLPSDGSRYRCRWIEESVTIHADGNVSCGLDDPHGARSFGNVAEQSVEQIFANPEYCRIQERLLDGLRCGSCGLYEKVEDDVPISGPRARLPKTLVIEPTIKCNLRCPQPACIPNNAPGLRTRDAAMLSEQVVSRVLEEVGPQLKQVYFFNYGEPFVHKGAEAMLLSIKERAPFAEVVTSTNGIPLKKYQRAENVVRSGLDFMTFTISGMTEESYQRYHVGGRLEDALTGLKNIVAAKRSLGAAKPEIVWRYLLFRWTDDEAEVVQAVELAEKLGVRLSLYLTDVPDGAASWRFAPGTPLFQRSRSIISSAHGYMAGEIDRNGFYPVEEVEGLGPARWTSYRARRHVRPVGNALHVAVSTNRPDPIRQSATIAVPWGRLEISLMPGRWRELSIEVPQSHADLASIEVRFQTTAPWHPADILGSQDLRCLGMLVREPTPQFVPHGPDEWAEWQDFSGLDQAHAARLDGFDEAPNGDPTI